MSYSNQPNLQDLNERKRFLQESIKYKTRRLQELQLKEAKFGLDTPVVILTEIADLKGEIEDFQVELEKILTQIEKFGNQLETSSRPKSQGIEQDFSVNHPAVARPINLSFDGPVNSGMPFGWFNSLGFVSYVSINYQVNIIARPDGENGACVLFQNPHATEDEFGSLMQRCLAHYLAGKVIRLEGEVKTSQVEKWAGLWLRADGADDTVLFFDNMYKRAIRGSTSWKKYVIDAQLPKETVWLNYGIVLAGRGMMWADNFRLMVWEEGKWVDI